MKLLVSLCNHAGQAQHADSFLCEVETETQQTLPIPLQMPRAATVTGLMGLACFGEDLLAVTQGTPTFLLRLTRQYCIRNAWPLLHVKDAHSLSVADGKAYIASTGTDAIVEFTSRRGEHLFWRDNDGGRDTLHLNSVLCHRGHLYATAFGKKQGDDWRSAEAGYLVNLTNGDRLAAPLNHPHSITASVEPSDERLYFCESQRMAIGRQDGQRLRVGSIYTRGLVVTATHFHVGFSRGRLTSRSNPSQPGNCAWMPGKCGVQVYRRTGDRLADCAPVATIDLDAYGAEVYDLLPL